MSGPSRDKGRKYVEGEVKKYAVVLFGRNACPACVSAKRLLSFYDKDGKNEKIQYVFMEELGQPLSSSVSSYLQVSTGRNASPFIFIGGNFVGNNVDLRNMAVQKTLSKAVKKAEEEVENGYELESSK